MLSYPVGSRPDLYSRVSQSAASSRFRFATRLSSLLALCWRVTFVLVGLAIAIANLSAEIIMTRAMRDPALSPQDRVARLELAGLVFPLDRNIRWSAERFRQTWNALVRSGGPRR